MKQEELIRRFLMDRVTEGKASAAGIEVGEDGRIRLVHYATTLAEIDGNKIHVNRTKYSVTTSKLQTWLRDGIRSYWRGEVIEHTDVPMGTRSLVRFAQEKEKAGAV